MCSIDDVQAIVYPAVVVLGPKRFEDELGDLEPERDLEVSGTNSAMNRS